MREGEREIYRMTLRKRERARERVLQKVKKRKIVRHSEK